MNLMKLPGKVSLASIFQSIVHRFHMTVVVSRVSERVIFVFSLVPSQLSSLLPLRLYGCHTWVCFSRHPAFLARSALSLFFSRLHHLFIYSVTQSLASMLNRWILRPSADCMDASGWKERISSHHITHSSQRKAEMLGFKYFNILLWVRV